MCAHFWTETPVSAYPGAEMDENIFSVTELNNRIKWLIEQDTVLANVCVQGEISNYKIYPSGHHYFTLKDAESSIRCVMFRSSASRLRFRPEGGMSVSAFGRVSVYPRDGAYQLYCTGLIPQGIGDLQLAFEQLKKKLFSEGLFDPAHKKPLPRFPDTIAVITSGAGAAVRDIIRISGARWKKTKLIVLPVRVQGTEAPAEIAAAIRYANRIRLADVIITGRGGGSLEDLWAFNDERVARAIYESEIPVISAVGHEPDVTISDFVADVRASTPSNAAELAVPDERDVRAVLAGAETRLDQAAEKRLRLCSERLEHLKSRPVLASPTGYIDRRRMELDMLSSRLISAQENALGRKKRGLIHCAASLDALSPLKVLSRGYASAMKDGEAVKSVSELKPGDKIRLVLSDGRADCLVEGTEERTGKNGIEENDL